MHFLLDKLLKQVIDTRSIWRKWILHKSFKVPNRFARFCVFLCQTNVFFSPKSWISKKTHKKQCIKRSERRKTVKRPGWLKKATLKKQGSLVGQVVARLLEKIFEKSSKIHIFQVFFIVVHVGLVDLSVNISPSNKTPVISYCVFLIDVKKGFFRCK